MACLARATGSADAALAKELGLTRAQFQALTTLVGDDRERLREAACRLTGRRPA